MWVRDREREGERQRQRKREMGERHRERWRERQTDGQRWRETESERDRDRERKRNRWKTDTERDRETDRDGERQRQGLRAYRETDTVGWGAELSRRVGRGGGWVEVGQLTHPCSSCSQRRPRQAEETWLAGRWGTSSHHPAHRHATSALGDPGSTCLKRLMYFTPAIKLEGSRLKSWLCRTPAAWWRVRGWWVGGWGQ